MGPHLPASDEGLRSTEAGEATIYQGRTAFFIRRFPGGKGANRWDRRWNCCRAPKSPNEICRRAATNKLFCGVRCRSALNEPIFTARGAF
jgi:hypothetical protein